MTDHCTPWLVWSFARSSPERNSLISAVTPAGVEVELLHLGVDLIKVPIVELVTDKQRPSRRAMSATGTVDEKLARMVRIAGDPSGTSLVTSSRYGYFFSIIGMVDILHFRSDSTTEPSLMRLWVVPSSR